MKKQTFRFRDPLKMLCSKQQNGVCVRWYANPEQHGITSVYVRLGGCGVLGHSTSNG